MSIEENKATACRLYTEVISGGNWAVADELLDVNLADYSNPPAGRLAARGPSRISATFAVPSVVGISPLRI